jgi:hypothetical protein
LAFYESDCLLRVQFLEEICTLILKHAVAAESLWNVIVTLHRLSHQICDQVIADLNRCSSSMGCHVLVTAQTQSAERNRQEQEFSIEGLLFHQAAATFEDSSQ